MLIGDNHPGTHVLGTSSTKRTQGNPVGPDLSDDPHPTMTVSESPSFSFRPSGLGPSVSGKNVQTPVDVDVSSVGVVGDPSDDLSLTSSVGLRSVEPGRPFYVRRRRRTRRVSFDPFRGVVLSSLSFVRNYRRKRSTGVRVVGVTTENRNTA